MGLFSGKSRDEKAREWATKKGLDVADAVAVDRMADGDARPVVLAVWHGRVERHRFTAPGAMWRGRAEVTTVDPSRISAVQVRHEGLTGVVAVSGSGIDMEYSTTQKDAERMASAIRSVMR